MASDETNPYVLSEAAEAEGLWLRKNYLVTHSLEEVEYCEGCGIPVEACVCPEPTTHVHDFKWTGQTAGPGSVIQRCECGEEYEKDVS